ncbi:redox-regulated ATPase YchF [Candidatus Curtissbacteria bacterium]|nr:redox-regulated ATPase YchF [Candidatus Curtissbacteria bacterium]
MNLSVGIVGLPNVGKSTLFNALLKKRVALSANYPFATVEPNVGVVSVPDFRLERLADLVEKEVLSAAKSNPSTSLRASRPPVIPAVVRFVDIAGLVKGAATGEGLGNKFLAHIREVDAIVHVLRDFNDEGVIRSGSVDPQADKEVVEAELALSDLEVVDKLLAGIDKEKGDADAPFKKAVLEQMKANLGKGAFAQSVEVTERLEKWKSTLPLLTNKPILEVYNVSEDRLSNQDYLRELSRDKVVICAKLEEELADLSEEDRNAYLAEFGLSETGLERLIKKAYEVLGLISFLTAGAKEVRAWTLRRGSTALAAAGMIHTDFERGFIAADVIEWDKLVEAGGWQAAKNKGLVRTIGKNEEIRDGYVVEFKFSV